MQITETVRFLDYMTSDTSLLLQNYGLEGEDFYYDNDGFVRRTKTGREKADDPQNFISLFWNFYNSAWEHSITPVPEPDSPDSLFTEMQCAFAKDKRTYLYDAGLLQNEIFSVKEVADAVGYHDYFFFAKAFKKTLGISPSKYRKELKKT